MDEIDSFLQAFLIELEASYDLLNYPTGSVTRDSSSPSLGSRSSAGSQRSASASSMSGGRPVSAVEPVSPVEPPASEGESPSVASPLPAPAPGTETGGARVNPVGLPEGSGATPAVLPEGSGDARARPSSLVVEPSSIIERVTETPGIDPGGTSFVQPNDPQIEVDRIAEEMQLLVGASPEKLDAAARVAEGARLAGKREEAYRRYKHLFAVTAERQDIRVIGIAQR